MDAIALNAILQDVHTDRIPDNFGKTFFNVQFDRISGLWDKAKTQGESILNYGTRHPLDKSIDYRFATTKPVPGEEKEQEKALLTNGGFINSYILTLFKLSATVRCIPPFLVQGLTDDYRTNTWHPHFGTSSPCL